MENEEFKTPWFTKAGEQWARLSPGYLISNMGRVFSEKTRKILKPFKNSDDYLRVSIYLSGLRHHTFIHIKVVELFGDRNGTMIPQEMTELLKNGFSIDHVDRNKNNNARSNLELVTHSENCIRKANHPIVITVVATDGKKEVQSQVVTNDREASKVADHFTLTLWDVDSLTVSIVTMAFGQRSEKQIYPKPKTRHEQMQICVADLIG